jgi:hypothetical protein
MGLNTEIYPPQKIQTAGWQDMEQSWHGPSLTPFPTPDKDPSCLASVPPRGVERLQDNKVFLL